MILWYVFGIPRINVIFSEHHFNFFLTFRYRLNKIKSYIQSFGNAFNGTALREHLLLYEEQNGRALIFERGTRSVIIGKKLRFASRSWPQSDAFLVSNLLHWTELIAWIPLKIIIKKQKICHTFYQQGKKLPF